METKPSDTTKQLPVFASRKNKNKKRKAVRKPHKDWHEQEKGESISIAGLSSTKPRPASASIYSTQSDRKRRRIATQLDTNTHASLSLLAADSEAVHDGSLISMGPRRSA